MYKKTLVPLADFKHPQGHVFYRRMNYARPMIARGEGIYLFDTEGRRYIDASGGPVLVNIGHGVPEVVEAMAEQARQAAYIHATMFTSQVIEDYSDALAGITPLPDPEDASKIILCSPGPPGFITANPALLWLRFGASPSSKGRLD